MVPPSLSQAQFPTQMGASRPIGTTSSMAPNFNQAQFAGQLSGGRIPANIDPNLFASQGSRDNFLMKKFMKTLIIGLKN